MKVFINCQKRHILRNCDKGDLEMNKTIMIVEDDHSFHNLYAEMLKELNYRIASAYDGYDALAMLVEEKPDLIILDVIMNMITGDTFLLYMKSMPEYANIPVIVVSNYCKSTYKSLKAIDPRIAFLDKTLIEKRLLGEIEARIG